MASLHIRRLKTEFDANYFLQGGIRLPLPYKGDERIYGLDGLTLVFSSPVGTVTFSDASNAGLLLKDVVDEINGDIAALRASLRDNVLYLVEVTPAAGVALTEATSTAAAIFRITKNIAGTFYNPPDGVAPRLISFADTGAMDGYTIITEE